MNALHVPDNYWILRKKTVHIGECTVFSRLMNSIKFNNSINYYCKNCNIKDKSSIFKRYKSFKIVILRDKT